MTRDLTKQILIEFGKTLQIISNNIQYNVKDNFEIISIDNVKGFANHYKHGEKALKEIGHKQQYLWDIIKLKIKCKPLNSSDYIIKEIKFDTLDEAFKYLGFDGYVDDDYYEMGYISEPFDDIPEDLNGKQLKDYILEYIINDKKPTINSEESKSKDENIHYDIIELLENEKIVYRLRPSLFEFILYIKLDEPLTYSEINEKINAKTLNVKSFLHPNFSNYMGMDMGKYMHPSYDK